MDMWDPNQNYFTDLWVPHVSGLVGVKLAAWQKKKKKKKKTEPTVYFGLGTLCHNSMTNA